MLYVCVFDFPSIFCVPCKQASSDLPPVAGAMEIILSSGLNAGEGASVEGELPVARSNSEEKTYPLMMIGCILLLASALFMVRGCVHA